MITYRVLVSRCCALLCGLFLLLSTLNASAAAPPPWDKTKQGKNVLCATVSANGQLWAGGEESGLWRFDPAAPGKGWTQFTVKDGLGEDNVYALASDKSGRLWVGHLNHGISVWNGVGWKNYTSLDAPLGERIFDIAVSPTNDDVWIASNLGLTRYSAAQDSWALLTRASGLPSDQIAALAFNAAGDLFAGTQCHGLAIARARDNYGNWQLVQRPANSVPSRMPDVAQGEGLPSNFINDVLVMSDGRICVATNHGLAQSTDDGATWSFTRGTDWQQKVKGLSGNPVPKEPAFDVEYLSEDWVTCLAEGPRSAGSARGTLWLGYRQRGFEVRDAAEERSLYASVDLAKNANDNVRAIVAVPGLPVMIGRYFGEGGGLEPALKSNTTTSTQSAPVPHTAPAFPSVASMPTRAQLEAAAQNVKAWDKPLAGGAGVYLGEDWTTAGDWVGRYGREYALLCTMSNQYADHVFTTTPGYEASGQLGPNKKPGWNMIHHIHWRQSENPRALYDPLWGFRRQSEWNDGSWDGETYPVTYEGPDIWVTVQVPEGVHRVSLNFFNKDGDDGMNRHRDFELELKPFFEKLEDAEAAPALARARVRDFRGSVYNQFALRGPGKFLVKVAKNNSFCTILQGVFIDKLEAPQTAPRTPWLGSVSYEPPAATLTTAGDADLLKAAHELWQALDGATGKSDYAFSQRVLRLQAYRAAVAAKASPALLTNWRWQLDLWNESDRTVFNETMTKAYQSLVEPLP